MSNIFVISSGESDDDLPPVTGVGLKEKFDQMDHKSHPDKNIEQRLQNEVKMNDDLNNGEENYHINESAANLLSDDRSSSPDIDMEPIQIAVKKKSADRQKGKKKSNTEIEKENKKQKLSEEKLAKKANAEMNKPENCMKVWADRKFLAKRAAAESRRSASATGGGPSTAPTLSQWDLKILSIMGEGFGERQTTAVVQAFGEYMNLEGHPSLWSRFYMENVPREVAATGAHVIQTPSLCNPGLLVWTRTIPRTLDSDGGQVKLSPLRERCYRAIFIADAHVVSELVSEHNLSKYLSQIRQLCDCKLTLVVFNDNDYFKKKGRGYQKSVRNGSAETGRKTSNSNRNPMTEIDFQLATTDLLVSADCDTIIANTASELAQCIVQLTKAVAEAPAKKEKRDRDDQAGFYLRGDNKNCISVDKNGVGVSRLWQQMLAILPQSSLETSRAICAQYKTPLALFESLESVPEAESIARLAEVGVSRAAAPGARARRAGPELARKLYTLFTATDGDQLIE